MSSTLEAYEHWAASYAPVPHNPLMEAEHKAMLELWPDVAGRRVLDLACGTGRYANQLQRSQAAAVMALDFSAAMLRRASIGHRVQADMQRLPFVDAAFAAVISGLALGHAIELQAWMNEVARVLAPGGVLLYSDFHPDAVRAGLTRSFRDDRGRSWTLPHRCYERQAQCDAAAAARLTIRSVREIRVGVEVQGAFPGSDAFYRQWHGLPLVLVVAAQK